MFVGFLFEGMEDAMCAYSVVFPELVAPEMPIASTSSPPALLAFLKALLSIVSTGLPPSSSISSSASTPSFEVPCFSFEDMDIDCPLDNEL